MPAPPISPDHLCRLLARQAAILTELLSTEQAVHAEKVTALRTAIAALEDQIADLATLLRPRDDA